MKESKYNFFVEPNEDGDSDSLLAFNAFTCALATMTRENYNSFIKGKGNGFESIDDELKKHLKHGRFIVDDECDEILELRNALLASRYNTSGFSLTIAPTLGCNFDCIYCYESDHSDFTKMSKETQEKLVALIKNKVDSGTQSISITWYGGEPLLAMDVIEDLSHQIYDLCEEAKIPYHAGMITNGYLLSRETVQRINGCHISFLQVTLDGPEDIHDKRRFLNGGHPTFDRIVGNLEGAIDILPHVALRINVDKDNVRRVDEVKKLFARDDLKEKISVYIAMVDAINENYDPADCLTIDKFIDMDIHFYENPMALYPRPTTNACGADAISHFVVAPDGTLYKCWDDIGIKEKCVGNIHETAYSYHPRYFEYMMFDATSDEECSNCKLLPICMGGCPHRRIVESPIRCTKYKSAIERYLLEAAQYLTTQKEREAS